MKQMIYFFVLNYAKICLRVFYTKIEVVGLEHIPKNQPVIFAANHQNAFIDAVLVACSTSRPIHFLVRAGVFKSPIAAWALGLLNMMPIYRFRDGLGEVRKNDQIINKCVKLLSQKQQLLIFPEGNHDLRRRLRPLQKGIGRIIYEAQQANDYQLGIAIVPIGINYTNHTAFRSKVLINFGKPQDVYPIINEHKANLQVGLKKINEQLAPAMQALIVHIPQGAHYDDLHAQLEQQRLEQSSLIEQLHHDQSIVKSLTPKGEVAPKKITKPNRWTLLNPIVLYGWINHIIPFYTLRFIIKPIEDRAFYASIKFAVGMALVPLSYALQIGLFHSWLSPSAGVSALYGASLPLFGLLAYRIYYDNNKKRRIRKREFQ